MSISVIATRQTKMTLIDIGRHPRKHKRALRAAFKEMGPELVDKIRGYILNPPKTGRIYVINGRYHQASAPGESPAWLTGRLARSADYKIGSYLEMRIGETAYYAKWLEEGTKDGRIAPRPHISRAVEASHRDMIRAIQENIQKEIEAI